MDPPLIEVVTKFMNTFVTGFKDKSTSDAVEGRHSQALLTTRVGEWIYQES